MKKLLILAGAVVIASQLTGCASIMNGTHQNVLVTTPPVRGARCMLVNNKGSWMVRRTPGTVRIHRSGKALYVNCNKAGFHKAKRKVDAHMTGAIAGNVIVGGIIGAGVDAADGAAFRYPNKIEVPMHK